MKIIGILVASLFSVGAWAAYDNSWYQTQGWSGEYPNGISIIKEGVSLPARAAMDLDQPVTIKCELPYKAVFHPWNQARPAAYWTAATIVPMTAKEDVILNEGETDQVTVQKGELVEYLVYGSEGWFTVRYNGKEYGADQSLLEKMSYDQSKMEIPQDEWLNVTCVGGENAWIYMNEVYSLDRDGNQSYPEGIDSWYRGFRDYGTVTDLTDEDLGEQKP
jgi:hypothetical protein